jgi:hypothetical protein
MMSSLLPPAVDRRLQSLERVDESEGDPTAVLRDTVEAIWDIVEQATSEPALDSLHHGLTALLARRELVQRATCTLSTVILRGVASGAFRPQCVPWAIERLPFATVTGACVHWTLGLATGPSLRASAAIEMVLEVLRPQEELAEAVVASRY